MNKIEHKIENKIENNTVILMRSPPGGGKSTIVKELQHDLGIVDVLSTDNYFLRPDGYYSWCFQDLGRAHAWNQKCFLSSISPNNYNPPLYIIVDNCNVTWQDCSFYIREAHNQGWNILLLQPNTDWMLNPEILAEKNTHRVPLETLKKVCEKWESSESIIRKAFEVGINKIQYRIARNEHE